MLTCAQNLTTFLEVLANNFLFKHSVSMKLLLVANTTNNGEYLTIGNPIAIATV